MDYNARIAPSSLEAERSVLGAMLLSGDAVMHCVEVLKKEDFYSAIHQEIFDAMISINRMGRPVDLITMEDALSKRGTFEGIGGYDYLIELSQFVPSTANVSSYAHIVEEKSTLRQLIAAADTITKDSYEAQKEVPDLLGDAEKSIYDITMKKGGNPVTHIHPVLISTYAYLEEMARTKGQISGVPTGYGELDNLTTGLHAGELVLVAARPSMGKTAFMLNLAQYAAIYGKKRIAVFSLEMPREQLCTRMLCCEANVDMQRARKGDLKDDDWVRLAQGMGALATSQIYIDDTSGLTVAELRSRCRRLQMEHGLDMVILDYLQLMSGSGRSGDNRQSEVSEISRSLKVMAQELHVPIIAGSQLSRAAATRQDHRPILSDLRDSGAIEQDADIVMFLHREDYYDANTPERNVAEIIIAKQRNGPLGTVKLAYLKEYTKFTSMAVGYAAGQ